MNNWNISPINLRSVEIWQTPHWTAISLNGGVLFTGEILDVPEEVTSFEPYRRL